MIGAQLHKRVYNGKMQKVKEKKAQNERRRTLGLAGPEAKLPGVVTQEKKEKKINNTTKG
jgi:hypothetical protein